LCGGTRAALALASGDLKFALSCNAFVVVVAFVAVVKILASVFQGDLVMSVDGIKVFVRDRLFFGGRPLPIAGVLVAAWVWNLFRW